MKIKVWLDEKFKEPEILICAQEKTEAVKELQKKLAEALSVSITGYTLNGAQPILCNDIIRIYSQKDRVFAECRDGIFAVRKKLYELEQILPEDQFVRISRSELVKIHKIKRMDTSLTGTIKMTLSGDVETYVSRRNVTKIKAILGL